MHSVAGSRRCVLVSFRCFRKREPNSVYHAPRSIFHFIIKYVLWLLCFVAAAVVVVIEMPFSFNKPSRTQCSTQCFLQAQQPHESNEISFTAGRVTVCSVQGAPTLQLLLDNILRDANEIN